MCVCVCVFFQLCVNNSVLIKLLAKRDLRVGGWKMCVYWVYECYFTNRVALLGVRCDILSLQNIDELNANNRTRGTAYQVRVFGFCVIHIVSFSM